MTTDDILRLAVECQLLTTENRDGIYADALIRFANRVQAKALTEPAEQEPKKDLMWSTVAMQKRHDQYIDHVVNTLESVKREQLTDEYKAVLLESRNQAMRLATQGCIQERGAYGGIAKE